MESLKIYKSSVIPIGKKKGDFPHGIYKAQNFMFDTPAGVLSLQQKEFMKHNYLKDSDGSLKASKSMKIQS